MVEVIGKFIEGNVQNEIFNNMAELNQKKNVIGELEGNVRLMEVEDGTLIVLEYQNKAKTIISPKVISVINGINIIYEDEFVTLSDVTCKNCGQLLRCGEVIDAYECCENCR